jgi:hypothetical protein
VNLAALIRILGAKGMSTDDIADVVELAMPASEPTRADRKRERDRVRMETKREVERQSRDTGDIALQDDTLSEGSQGSFSPTPPKSPNPPNLSQVPPIVPQKRASKASLSTAFEQFWAVYPKKVGKGAAERAFPKALALADIEALTAAATAYAAKVADVEAGLIKHPSGWLNDKRWLDTYDPPPGSTVTVFDVTRRRAQNDRLYEDIR